MSIVQYLNWLVREQANQFVINICYTNDGIDFNGHTQTDTTENAANYIAEKLVPTAKAIWLSAHLVKPSAVGKPKITKDDVEAYRYLLVDVDAVVAKAKKACATDDERAKTMATADKVAAMLVEHGLPQPLKIMSGNGSLLLFPIDLPNTEANHDLLKQFSDVMADIFDDADCKIDSGVMIDPSRLIGVVGTMNRHKAESPIEGRLAMERAIVGDYPPNEPMAADAFTAAVKAMMAEHTAVADAMTEKPTTAATNAIADAMTDGDTLPSGWQSVETGGDNVARCKAYISKLDDAVSGQRGHDKTFHAACECYRFGLSDADAKQMMDWFNQTKCKPSWSDAELAHKLSDAFKEVCDKGEFGCRLNAADDADLDDDGPEAGHGGNYPMTELGNAQHFADLYGAGLRYIVAWKCWIIWDGKRWIRDNTNKVRRRGLKYVRSDMPKHATTIKDDERRTKYLKWAGQSQSDSKIDAMISLASTILGHVGTDELDAKPNLFNCDNGTLELDSLKFRPHDRRDMLTKITSVKYDPAATAPTWDRFISRIFQDASGNPRLEVIEYIRRAAGYSMTADTSAQCFFVLHGKGRNGKTTFMDAIKNILGGYAMNGLQTLLLQIGGNISRNTDDEADLFGKRLVLISETAEGQRFDESKIKRIVGGGDRMKVMRKFEHPFEFQPTHKTWLDCNHKPKVKGDDEGIWRRIKLIPFLVQIPLDERDENLGDKLKAEASGILNWMLQGLAAWRADGGKLSEPKEVSEAVGGYRADSDDFGLFLCECLENNDAAKTATMETYSRYVQWADQNGMNFKLTKVEFGRRMAERGYESKPSNGVRYFFGCSLRPMTADAADAVDERAF
jgi:P4 family phage/plasmid primase-like protien